MSKAIKFALLVQKFWLIGGFYLVMELHWEGSAPAQQAFLFLFTPYLMQTGKERTKTNLVQIQAQKSTKLWGNFYILILIGIDS